LTSGILVSKVSVEFHITEKYGQYNEESNKAWDELVQSLTDHFTLSSRIKLTCALHSQNGLFALKDLYRYVLQPGHVDAEDENVAWFGVSVFHQLHCPRALRDTVRELKTGQPARE
jgi:hypothetical protein